ncbi:hypothetical protein RchiOBHm_Chr3g0486221 [Rosa chinensis]|uniref:Uncharacterized protein n=1 Tax=Rosa chinensis TaxID=74649 RepID=A0A2P6RF92_ROSCH|nr:hypothetical protein RchiOBHm_Chr3g0486221 [Rosa chinensis]
MNLYFLFFVVVSFAVGPCDLRWASHCEEVQMGPNFCSERAQVNKR